MKNIIVKFKNPDIFYQIKEDIVYEAKRGLLDYGEHDITEAMEEEINNQAEELAQNICDKFLKYKEYLTVEFNLDNLSAKVIENK